MTEENFPKGSVVINNRAVTLAGAGDHRVYIDLNQITNRVILTNGAYFYQTNLWVDDCFLPDWPFICFTTTTGGSSLVLDNVDLSDAGCTHVRESKGIHSLITAAKFSNILTGLKVEEVDSRTLRITETGWVPYLPPPTRWRIINSTFTCTGNITHYLPYKESELSMIGIQYIQSVPVSIWICLLAITSVLAHQVYTKRRGMAASIEEKLASLKGFKLQTILGSGFYGKVYKAKQVATDRLVAIKVISLTAGDFGRWRAAVNELFILKGMSRHPSCINILHWYKAVITKNGACIISSGRMSDGGGGSRVERGGVAVISTAPSPSPSTPSAAHPLVSVGLNVMDAFKTPSPTLLTPQEQQQQLLANNRNTLLSTNSMLGPRSPHISPAIRPVGEMSLDATATTATAGGDTTNSWVYHGAEGGADGGTEGLSLSEMSPVFQGEVLGYQIHLVMEYCDIGTLTSAIGGSLFTEAVDSSDNPFEEFDSSVLLSGRRPNIRNILATAVEISHGVQFLHNCANPVIHRDLSTNNVLLKTDTHNPRGFRAVVSDFGLSMALAPDATHHTSTMNGTVAFMSPEAISDNVITSALDVYSFGIILYMLWSGVSPYNKMGAWQICIQKNREQCITWEEGQPCRPPSDYQSLVAACTARELHSRPSIFGVTRCLEGMVRFYD